MFFLRKTVCVVCTLCALCFATAAEAAIVETEGVQVTGSRLAKKLTEVTNPTYVMTRQEIEQSSASNVQEALSRVPGTNTLLSSASLGQEQSVVLRGLSTEVLVMIDGVPYNSASHGAGMAAYDLRSIPLDSVERIEVVKGTASAIYGSHAAGGVINIITKKGTGKNSLIVKAEGGSDGYVKGTVRATAVDPKDGLKATLTYSHTEEKERNIRKLTAFEAAETGRGFDRSLSYRGNDYALRLEKGSWAFLAEAGDYKSEWENTSTYKDDVSTGTDRQKNNYKRFSAHYDDGTTLARLFFFNNEKEYTYRYDSIYPSVTNYNDSTFGVTVSRRAKLFGQSGVFGFDLKNESSKVWGEYSYNRNRTELAPFLELSLPVGSKGLFDVGLRYEHWDMGGNGDNRNEFLPRFSFSWNNDSGSVIYASAGRYLAMPSLYETDLVDSWGSVLPNPNLKPEYGWSYELGVKNLEAVTPWNLGLFYMDMKDKIKYFSDPNTYKGWYANLDEYRAYGFEGTVKISLGRGFSYTQGLTYTRADEKESDSSSWTRSGMPRWDVLGILGWHQGPWTADFEMHYYADRELTTKSYDYDDSFFLANMSVAWKQGDTKVRIGVRNLFDKEVVITNTGSIAPERRLVVSLEHQF